ncbi:MAG: glycoside hydrolase family protein [Kiritimatiellales bacterium]|nr:glycoside hydrolase family protein [Kiritimatiellales bacterium]
MERKMNSMMPQTGRLSPRRQLGMVYLLVVCLACLGQTECNSSGLVFSVKTHSTKKGTGITPLRLSDWQQRLDRLHPAWFYTWRPLPPDGVSGNMEFVPMLWGTNALSAATAADLTSGAIDGRYKNLLVLNEPDAASQANVSVAAATNLWPNVVATGLRLGSPATVNSTNLWMQSFVSSIESTGQRLDFIAVHWYGGANPDNLLRQLETVHQLYGRPIWITEFAVADWGAANRGYSLYSPEQVLAFMKTVIPALEQLDYIERYSWFSPVDPNNPSLWQSALFDGEGNLTLLGRTYAEF